MLQLAELFDIGTDSLISSLPSIFSGDTTFDTATFQDENLVTKAKMIDKEEVSAQKRVALGGCTNSIRNVGIDTEDITHMRIDII